MKTPHPHHVRRWDDCRAAAASKAAAGLRVLAGRKLKEAPVPVIEDFTIREHGDGIRSIPEPVKRRDNHDREMRISLPFVPFQYGDAP